MIGPVRVLLVAIAVAHAVPAAAQDSSRWGISGSFVPRWEFLHFIEDAMERNVELEGADLSIGIVRGRQFGGEWGISFVQRRIEDERVEVEVHRARPLASTRRRFGPTARWVAQYQRP